MVITVEMATPNLADWRSSEYFMARVETLFCFQSQSALSAWPTGGIILDYRGGKRGEEGKEGKYQILPAF